MIKNIHPETVLGKLSRFFPFIPIQELLRVSEFIRNTNLDEIDVLNDTGIPTEQITFFLNNIDKMGIRELESEIEQIEDEIDSLVSEKHKLEEKLEKLEKSEEGIQISLYEMIK